MAASGAAGYHAAMKPRVYIETTIPSYLTAWPSRDLIRAAHQQSTREWWAAREGYELFVSRLVLQECSAGDPRAAADRLAALTGIPVLGLSPEILTLAADLFEELRLPEKAAPDAHHIATAARHGIKYLLTWNCRHIANARHRPVIEDICQAAGCEPPVICTPDELRPVEGDDDGDGH
ncbi:MAG: type II toxin-antitoxin system VapC family toxin [Gemmataceae bacterium]|nr:type II toxin-antitoxin system VapC family toxin [Gemmataceae bacterium]